MFVLSKFCSFFFLNKNYILVEHCISQLMQFKWLYSRYDEIKSSPERNYSVFSAILYRVMLTYYGLEFLVLQSDSKLIFNLKKGLHLIKKKSCSILWLYCPRLLITGIYPPSWKWNTDDNEANLSWWQYSVRIKEKAENQVWYYESGFYVKLKHFCVGELTIKY